MSSSWRYFFRRIVQAIPILIGVNLITFALFFVVNPPDNMARLHLGMKHVSDEAITEWKQAHGYDRPLLVNTDAQGWQVLTDTLFWQQSLRLARFDFGLSDGGRDILADIHQRMLPSLALAVPSFVLGVATHLSFALLLVMFRFSRLNDAGVVLCVLLMSVSGLFYIIFGQYLFGKILHWAPISGYLDGLSAWRFVWLPVLIGVLGGLGASSRFYRTLFLEEVARDYVRTARAKGLSEWAVLYRHVLRNALIPILTGLVSVIPLLFMGSLIMESFFAIPGLGSYTINAINGQDFAIVRAMVYLGSLLYILGLLLTDLAYLWADPRVRL